VNKIGPGFRRRTPTDATETVALPFPRLIRQAVWRVMPPNASRPRTTMLASLPQRPRSQAICILLIPGASSCWNMMWGHPVRRTDYDGSLGSYVVINDQKFLANGGHSLRN